MSMPKALMDSIRVYDFFKAERTDSPSPEITYVAHAVVKAQNNEAKWLIVRYQTVGTVVEKRFAEGNTEADKVWNDRATYTYL